MSFREYVKRRRITDTPAGDFTRDAQMDPNMPDARNWAELRAYLERVSNLPGVIPAGQQVWQAYRRQRPKG